jgi:hypothetical protein
MGLSHGCGRVTIADQAAIVLVELPLELEGGASRQ